MIPWLPGEQPAIHWWCPQQGSDPVLYLKECPRAKGIFTKDLNSLQRNQLGENSCFSFSGFVCENMHTHVHVHVEVRGQSGCFFF